MSILGRLFGKDPEQAKTERHKRELAELKEVLRSEEIKLNLALRDVEELKQIEEELMEKGKAESSEIGRRTIAYKIRDIREKQKGLESRVGIYDNRIRVLREQINSLETLVEAGAAGLPEEKKIEEASFEASRKLEKLNQLLLKVEGSRTDLSQEDEEIGSIMKEFDARADLELDQNRLEFMEKPGSTEEKPSKERGGGRELNPPENE